MTVVILAGGLGTRLKEVAKDIPKPFVKVQGKPVLEYHIENFQRFGIYRFIFVIGHLGHKIRKHFGDGAKWKVSIEYFDEPFPLGTAGAFYYLQKTLPEEFFVVYGDLIYDIDFDRFIKFHRNHGKPCTLMVHANDHPADSDIMVSNPKAQVLKILKKNMPRDVYYLNRVNAGIFLIGKHLIKSLEEEKKQDFEIDVIQPAIERGEVVAYKSTEYLRDMGTPTRLQSIQDHVARQIPMRCNLKKRQRAVFLDRDGTLCRYVGLLYRPDQLHVFDSACAALQKINGSEFLAVSITHQSVVSKGFCSLEQLEEIHRKLETELGKQNVYIDLIVNGFDAIQQCSEEWNIDLASSYWVGDCINGMQTAKQMGLQAVLISELPFSNANFCAKNLLDALNLIGVVHV